MTDDIVTRLRLKSASQIDVVTRLEKKCLCCPCCEEFCLYCETVGQFADAADEIELLRADIEQRAKLMSQIVELLVPFSMLMNKHEQELLLKAVRGD